ncbi:MAG: hypothetical protein AABX23_01605 [Nanoarchaeota archaeon]
MANDQAWEHAKEHYLRYVSEFYPKRITEALVERIRGTKSSRDANMLVGDLEQILTSLQNGEAHILPASQIDRERALRGKITRSGFKYDQNKYLDVFGAIRDFAKQVRPRNRELAMALKVSFRTIAKLISTDPPYPKLRRSVLTLETKREGYIERFAQYACLSADEKAHLETLPAVHPNHYVSPEQ